MKILGNKVFWVASCLFLSLGGHAQDAQPSGERKVQMETRTVESIFPVHQKEGNFYLEFPREVWGRELLIAAQIDKGFDLINRPVSSLGVVRLGVDSTRVVFRQPYNTDRLLKQEGNELLPSFEASNMQTNERAYPIAFRTQAGGVAIDLSELVASGDEWFDYSSYGRIRRQDTRYACISGIVPLTDGVGVKIRRRHVYSPERPIVSSAAMMLPEGTMPLELSCTIRLLPREDASIRLAHRSMNYRTVHFRDFSQNPYKMVEDSLIVRWRMEVPQGAEARYAKGHAVTPQSPLVIGIDRFFPREFHTAVYSVLDIWKQALEKAGFKDAFQVKVLTENDHPEDYRILLSYDLGDPGLQSDYVHHPRTGEILWARVNVGHGFLPGKLMDYWWQEGAGDKRILKDKRSPEVASELLADELLPVIGSILGLSVPDSDPLLLHVPVCLDESVMQHVERGYRVFAGSKDCYDDRAHYLRWLKNGQRDIPDSGQTEVCRRKLETIKAQFSRLDKEQGDVQPLYKRGVELYGDYLVKLAGITGGEQQQAMELLIRYLFRGSEDFESRKIVENMQDERYCYLDERVKAVFASLLSGKNIESLQKAEWYDVKGAYTAQQFFADLYSGVFGGFSLEESWTEDRMRWAMLCVESWKAVLASEETAGYRLGKERLQKELDAVKEKLRQMARDHESADMRAFCALLVADT